MSDTKRLGTHAPDPRRPATFEHHIEHLELYGYTVVDDVWSTEDAMKTRKLIERLYRSDPGVAPKRATPSDTYHVENLPNKGRIFETFFLNDSVLPLVDHFLSEDCIAQDIWSFGVAPGSVGYPLHCDDEARVPGTPLSVVTVFPLVDFTSANGGTRVVPGSHWIPYYPKKSRYDTELAIQAPVGSCIVLFGSLWHATGPNVSTTVRSSVAAYFTVPWIKPNIDYALALHPHVLARATARARRIYGLDSRITELERWESISRDGTGAWPGRR